MGRSPDVTTIMFVCVAAGFRVDFAALRFGVVARARFDAGFFTRFDAFALLPDADFTLRPDAGFRARAATVFPALLALFMALPPRVTDPRAHSIAHAGLSS
jgi:hypothetical protein